MSEYQYYRFVCVASADFVPPFQAFLSEYSRRGAPMKRLEMLRQAVEKSLSSGE